MKNVKILDLAYVSKFFASFETKNMYPKIFKLFGVPQLKG
jgi:hypothetical protein